MNYIAAGLDPARFWDLTPRLLDIEFRGASARMRRERELVWFNAMMPHFKKPIPLDKFVGGPVDDRDRVKRFHSAWDQIDRALRG